MELIGVSSDIAHELKSIVERSRRDMAAAVNHELLRSYWRIGKAIANEEVKNYNGQSERDFFLDLSRKLKNELGRGFSRANLISMKKFFKCYPSPQTLSGHLSWPHYRELLAVSGQEARSFYEKECLLASWSAKELRRQIEGGLLERVLLSSGDLNKLRALWPARKGQEARKPEEALGSPRVLEFLGLPEEKPYWESELEKRIAFRLKDFLLGLGRGFTLVGMRQLVAIGKARYYVDAVFYNKILKAYVLIDLEIGSFRLENAGRMNGCVDYYKAEVSGPDDNPPIGIIVAAKKGEVVAEYALGGLESRIFASKYKCCIPDKKQLVRLVEAVLSGGGQEAEEG
jgi:predicted nuclease of restriction endonuclease-like (RecB) superfamily